MFRGHGLNAGEIFVSGSGAQAEAVSRGAVFPTALSLRLDFLETQLEWLNDAPARASNASHVRSPGVEWVANFLNAVAWVIDAVTHYPQAAKREDVRGSLIDGLLARVNTLGAVSALSHDRNGRASRRLAVAHAREYIRANVTEPIRLSDLCLHSHSRARTLEYGFREVFGVSPMT